LTFRLSLSHLIGATDLGTISFTGAGGSMRYAELVDKRGKWLCSTCRAPGVCDICETCVEHCCVQTPNDLAVHRRFDHEMASSDAKRRPN
jgi:hypothetical protein